MLRLPPFTYLAPKTLTEAVRLLVNQAPDDTMLVAGGTDLYPNMKRRQFTPAQLVGLRQIRDLQQLTGDAQHGLSIGAGLTLTQISQHPTVIMAYPALATAAELVSTPQLRNMGTIGGNLCLDTRCNYYNQTYWWRQAIGFCMKKDGDTCWVAPGSARCWAVSSSDTAPVLIALQAHVRLVGPQGERLIPIHDLYRDDGIQYLAKRLTRFSRIFCCRPLTAGACITLSCGDGKHSISLFWVWRQPSVWLPMAPVPRHAWCWGRSPPPRSSPPPLPRR